MFLWLQWFDSQCQTIQSWSILTALSITLEFCYSHDTYNTKPFNSYVEHKAL